MKRVPVDFLGVLSLAAVVVVLFTPCASAVDDDGWKYIKYQDGIFCYYDPESVTNLPNRHRKISIKVLPIRGSGFYSHITNDLKQYGLNRELLFFVMSYEVDCADNRTIPVELVCYDRQRRIINLNLGADSLASITLPKIIHASARKIVCK